MKTVAVPQSFPISIPSWHKKKGVKEPTKHLFWQIDLIRASVLVDP